jgi:serine protease AprX
VKFIKPDRAATWLALVSMLAYLLGGFVPVNNSVRAQGRLTRQSKLSPDLADRVRGAQGGARVDAIVQFEGRAGRALDALLLNHGATVKRVLRNFNARVVNLPLNAVEALAAQSDVRYISPDRQIRTSGHVTTTTGTEAVRTQTTYSLLGLITTTTTFDGSGIGIAIVDSGVDVSHASLRNSSGLSRVVASQDFTGENRTDDTYGHGTHVASIAAGNNQISSGAYTGIASNASVINLRVLDSQGLGSTSSLLAGLDWVMTFRTLYNIRVVNLSLGTPAVEAYWNDPLCQAVRRLTDAGIVVVAAAGNNGKDGNGNKVYGRIHSPGNEPSAMTVGASNTLGTDARSDDSITTYSSRGPTRSYWTDESGIKHYDNLMKPDLTAPGNKIVGAAAVNNYLLNSHPEMDADVSTMTTRRMMYLSGTSMATPVAAGAAALLLQAKPSLTPNLVKAILMYTAQPLAGSNMFEQGAGEINIEGAMRLAKLVRTDLTGMTTVGAPLLTNSPGAEQTSLGGQTFTWARGIILNHTYAVGFDLINKYQRVYATGFTLGDGVVETQSSQAINPAMMSSGVQLGTNILLSDGTSLGGGTSFLDTGMLLGDGILITDGIMITDGILISDGILITDGILISDSVLQAQSALLGGDDTARMR